MKYIFLKSLVLAFSCRPKTRIRLICRAISEPSHYRAKSYRLQVKLGLPVHNFQKVGLSYGHELYSHFMNCFKMCQKYETNCMLSSFQ